VPLLEAIGWIALTGLITIGPTIGVIMYLRRQDKHVYQREVRLPIYGVAWISLGLCALLLWFLDAPERLFACVVAAMVWIPIQAGVNEFYTKISGHTAFSMGVLVGLLMLGELDTMLLKGLAAAIVLLVAWARHVTKNHTPLQIVLGWLVAGVSVGVSFWIILD
jgi:membrane-associated phospholipid phosphatase